MRACGLEGAMLSTGQGATKDTVKAAALLENPALPKEAETLKEHGVPDSGAGRWTLHAAIDANLRALKATLEEVLPCPRT